MKMYRAREVIINITGISGDEYTRIVSPTLDYWGISDEEYVVSARERASTLIQGRHPLECVDEKANIVALERGAIKSYSIKDGNEIELQGREPQKGLLYIAGAIFFIVILTMIAMISL